MTNLETTPTSELLRELNLRALQPRYEVRELPPPAPDALPRWGVYTDGEVRVDNRGRRWPCPHAVCTKKTAAENIADLLNRQQAQRAQSEDC